MRATFLLAWLPTALFAATPVPVTVEGILAKHPEVKSVPEFLAVLPPEWRENWVPVFSSGSLQRGTRILLSSPDGRTSLTFNLPSDTVPGQTGTGSIEIKEFDPTTKRFVFSELGFQKDFGKTDAKTPAFENGRYFERDVLNKELHGDARKCAICHPMGRTRFDLREVVARLKTSAGAKAEFLRFAKRFREADPRLVPLTVSAELRKILDGSDADAAEKHFVEAAQRHYDRLLPSTADAVSARVLEVLAKKPGAAFGLLAILKKCPFEALFSRPAWNRVVNGFKYLPDDKRKAALWSIQLPKGKRSAEPVLTAMLNEIRSQRDDKARLPKVHVRTNDDKTDLELLAKLEVFWNPINLEVLGHDVDLGENTKVGHWSPTAHIGSYWFENHFDRYQKALERDVGAFVATKLGIPPADQKCERLSEESVGFFMRGSAGSTPSGPTKPTHD